MACTVSGFSLDPLNVDQFPYSSKCNIYTNVPSGCLKPGDLLDIYVNVNNNTGWCRCATVAFSVNGTVFSTVDVCVAGSTWSAYSYLEARTTYTIPSYGIYNFCAEVVAVR
jgi:hypothetical protein